LQATQDNRSPRRGTDPYPFGGNLSPSTRHSRRQIMKAQTTAEEQALALARHHNMSLEALAGRLLNDLCALP